MSPRDLDNDLLDDDAVLMPDDLAAKFDAIGPEGALFSSVTLRPDLVVRDHVRNLLSLLKGRPDWSVEDAVRLAGVFPRGFGILGSQTEKIIRQLWEELERSRSGDGPGLGALLSIEAWADRDIPEPDYLLGALITRTSRLFIVGTTGLGKTMLGLAMASGMAAGTGFLRWRSNRPVRVLYVDGEMPAELIKARSIDALRRAGDRVPPPGNLMIYARDVEEQVAADFPSVGRMEALNTDPGHNFVLALIDALGGVDVVIFDNVMSLVAGDQKDELSWSETLPLVQSLTARRIGQVWLDHTGHNSDRQYGSSTKAWRFDTVGVMKPLPDDKRQPREVAFTLSFDYPGKARRRTPDNWAEFEPCTIRLADDRWSVDADQAQEPGATRPNESRLRDKPAMLLRELRSLIAAHGSNEFPVAGGPMVTAIGRQVLRTALVSNGWFPETMLRIASDGTPELGRSGYPAENHALTTLKRNGFLAFTRDLVWLL